MGCGAPDRGGRRVTAAHECERDRTSSATIVRSRSTGVLTYQSNMKKGQRSQLCVIRSSEIHAAGVFATRLIRKGTRILEYDGPRLPKSDADLLYKEREDTYLFGIGDGDVVIDGHSMAMFLNHSCAPNCETEEDHEERVWIMALRDIKPGEELTYDYFLYDGEENDPAPCYCGASSCRGTMYANEERKKTSAA